jgi:hypothetical protein
MAQERIIEFPQEGVIVKLDAAHANIYVDKKPLVITPAMRQPQILPNANFAFIDGVINIVFYQKGGPQQGLVGIAPRIKLRIRYKRGVKTAAAGKPKKLAWWDDQLQQWNVMPSSNTSSMSKNWAGYGDTDTDGWPDPPIAWGT